MSVLADRVLVLNGSWTPIHTTTVRTAVTLLYREAARVVDAESYQTFDFDSWRAAARFAEDATRRLQGPGWFMAAPEVIVLTAYRARSRRLPMSRRNLFIRDRSTCQYCGRRPARTTDLTLDHVIPRGHGGRSTWENLVVACQRCNQRKGCRTPRQAGLTLRRTPARPARLPVLLGTRRPPVSWEAFLSDLYWDQELEA